MKRDVKSGRECLCNDLEAKEKARQNCRRNRPVLLCRERERERERERARASGDRASTGVVSCSRGRDRSSDDDDCDRRAGRSGTSRARKASSTRRWPRSESNCISILNSNRVVFGECRDFWTILRESSNASRSLRIFSEDDSIVTKSESRETRPRRESRERNAMVDAVSLKTGRNGARRRGALVALDRGRDARVREHVAGDAAAPAHRGGGLVQRNSHEPPRGAALRHKAKDRSLSLLLSLSLSLSLSLLRERLLKNPLPSLSGDYFDLAPHIDTSLGA